MHNIIDNSNWRSTFIVQFLFPIPCSNKLLDRSRYISSWLNETNYKTVKLSNHTMYATSSIFKILLVLTSLRKDSSDFIHSLWDDIRTSDLSRSLTVNLYFIEISFEWNLVNSPCSLVTSTEIFLTKDFSIGWYSICSNLHNFPQSSSGIKRRHCTNLLPNTVGLTMSVEMKAILPFPYSLNTIDMSPTSFSKYQILSSIRGSSSLKSSPESEFFFTKSAINLFCDYS